MWFCTSNLENTCGVELLYNFRKTENKWDHQHKVEKNYVPSAGVGLLCAGFRTQEAQDMEMYHELASIYPIVYESEPRVNRNSNNEFIFVVFDAAQTTDNYGYDDHDEEYN